MADRRTHFGHTLRTLRAAAGLTQAELAERAGVSVSTISQWEQRESAPRVWSNTLRRVSKTLDAIPQPGRAARSDLGRRARQRATNRSPNVLAALEEYPDELGYLLGDAWRELSAESKRSIIHYMEYELLRSRGELQFSYDQ
jgi:transcriptional regulator with XRE-family HTH domain